jgi:hypothetical protein
VVPKKCTFSFLLFKITATSDPNSLSVCFPKIASFGALSSSYSKDILAGAKSLAYVTFTA